MQWIKDFEGHSGCKIQLCKDDERYVVIKSGSDKLKKSASLLKQLSRNYPIPKIYSVGDEQITMEYVNGMDMKTYLLNADNEKIEKLYEFIDLYIRTQIQCSSVNDLSFVIYKKIKQLKQNLDQSILPFSLDELFERLPKSVSTGLVHGDFTLDNMLYFNDKFYLIDSNPTDISSVEYDVNKLRQDLDCLWFVRKESNKIDYKINCKIISDKLKNKWTFLKNDSILIFMLVRILPYCKNKSNEKFIIKEIKKLWHQ